MANIRESVMDFTQDAFEMELGWNPENWILEQDNDNYLVVRNYTLGKCYTVKRPDIGWSLAMLDWIQIFYTDFKILKVK